MLEDKRPSEPKIDVKAVRAMLEEVLDTKLSAQDERLMDGISKLLQDEWKKHSGFIGGVLRWVASQLEKKS